MSLFIYQAVFASTAPVISSFDADESLVTPGTDVTLTWVVSDADEIYLNGTLLDPLEVGSSIDVSPLIATTYTLQAVNAFGSDSAALTVQVTNAPTAIGADVRFVEVVKNVAGDRLHLSEIEVFELGVTPDNADGDGTSSNNLVLSASPSVVIPPTTTGADLNAVHTAVPEDVFDGDLESSAAVWSTNDGLTSPGLYMLDLGATYTIDIVRLFGRADGSSRRGLENFSVNVYADDGTGNPGALVSTASYPGTAPNGNAGNAEFSFGILEPGITSFSVSKTTIAAGEDITFSWTVSKSASDVYIDNGVGDVLPLTDAQGEGDTTITGPSVDTTYLLVTEYPNGTSVASITVRVTDQPLIHGFGGDAGIVAPGTAVQLSWDVVSATSLSLNGVDVTGLSMMTVNPTITASYELIATNANGTASEELTVLVVNSGEPIISEFLSSNGDGLTDEDGETSDWIEIYNSTASSLNLNGYYLSDDPLLLTKWSFPSVSLAPGEYLLVFASSKDRSVAGSELHTNFSLSSGGDYLALVKPNGTTILSEFQPTYPKQKTDISYGFDEAALKFGYFQSPTPGAANGESASDFVADTAFSLDRGFYDAPIAVAITSATLGAEIRYTVDGTEPTAVTGQSYVNPIVISETTVLRAVALKSGLIPTNVDTQTYIFTADVVTQSNLDTAITQDPTYGPQMEDALKAVPTISLVFEGDIERTEKGISMEFINFEAGSTQVGVGMERFGNYATDFSKRSMRMTFRNQYGPGKFDFPVYDGHDYPIPPAAQFDGLELRSGNHDMSMRGAYMSNRFTDDTMMDMGNIAPHGRFVHVYINGLYWGQYHLRERWNASMLSEYYGGSKADYEAVNANNAGKNFDPNDGSIFDGTGVSWEAAKTVRDEIALGNQSFPDIVDLVDIPNLIDFVLLWLSGNSENEYRAAGGVPLGVPFKFFMKDADGFLRGNSKDVLEDGPLDLMSILRTDGDADYLTLVADRIHKHFFNDGAFTPAKNIERLQDRVDEIQLSFLAESARWGERTPASWQSYQDNLINNHFPGLTAQMISRFQAAGLYPSLSAPVFSQHGGDVTAGFLLTMTSAVPTIYYTLDGSDPRVFATATGTTPPITVVTENAAKSVYIPTTTNDGFTDGQGDAWNELNYNEGAGWTSGTGGVGFENSPGDAINFDSLIDIDVGGAMSGQYTSCLVRTPFSLSAGSLSGRQVAELRVRYDDGYVAYLNGTEIARRNFTGTPDGLSAANGQNSDASAVNLEVVDISAHMNLFIDGGSNILAIHGMNRTVGSSDFLISADLVLGESGATGTSGAISSSAIAYSGPVQIDESTLVRARVFDGSNWSALNEAFFTVNAQEPSVGDLVISEIHYNGYESGDVEFVEFYNNAAYNLIMDGVQITDGVTFLFPNNLDLKVGERLVVVSDLNAFFDRYQDIDSPWYHSGIQVAGEYIGSLSGSGENITVEDTYGVELLNFEYNDSGSWPGRPDGFGSTLELTSPTAAPVTKIELDAYLDDGDSWRASREFHGTPGWEGLGPDNRVVFNEVLPHTDLPLKDSFELYNTTGSSINISGWLISDNTSTYAKFQIPNGTNIAAGGFLVYDEDDFNSGSNLIDFALNSSLGDDLYLLETDSEDNPISFVDHIRFDPSKNGEAFGRWPDGDGKVYPMINRTLGQLNTSVGNGVRTGPVVVSEIHYSPLDPNQPLEYIEIFNAGSVTENLVNWRLRGEADFDFASESLAPGGVLVITSFDPITDTLSLNQFLAKYPEVSSSQLRGPWSAGATNRLNNGGAAVKLQRPDTLQVPPVGDPFYPMLIEDTVNYDNQTPWPASADGTGPSLERMQTDVYGDLASNWQANATPSPGTHNMHVFGDYDTWAVANSLGSGPSALRLGDFDYDGSLNLVEFALVKKPWDSSDGQPFEYGFKQLTVGLETAEYLTVDYQYRTGAGLTVEAYVSSDLENWVPLVDEYAAPIDHGNGVQSVFFRDFVDSDEHSSRFIKIEVIEE